MELGTFLVLFQIELYLGWAFENNDDEDIHNNGVCVQIIPSYLTSFTPFSSWNLKEKKAVVGGPHSQLRQALLDLQAAGLISLCW